MTYGQSDTQTVSAKQDYVGRDPDFGHVGEQVTILDEQTEQLLKTFDALTDRLGKVLNQGGGEVESDQAIPTPIRCSLADDLSRINGKLGRLLARVHSARERIDL